MKAHKIPIRLFLILAVSLSLFVAGLGWWATRTSPKDGAAGAPTPVAALKPAMETAPAPDAFSTSVPAQVLAHGFTGSAACKECHAEQYRSWHASYHRRMTQVASPESVIGQFELGQPVSAYGRDFTLSRKGDQFWVETDAYEQEAAQDTRIDRRIALTTGSHHMQIYWYATQEGRSLAQLPIAWLRETESWVPTSALFISPPGQPLKIGHRRWNEVCIKCHTTGGQPRIKAGRNTNATAVVDTVVSEFGISCEACHGPGRDHVAAQRTSGEKTAGSDPIVHPGTIDHVRSSQICGQCHGNWLPDEESGLDRYLWAGTCFRAGEDLHASRHVFGIEEIRSPFIRDFLASLPHYLEDRYWGDGMIRVSGGEYNGLASSQCFQSGALSCISCHQMHHAESDGRTLEVWADDQLKSEALGRETCIQCHAQFRSDAAQAAHSHHPASSTGAECYNCHMPHTSYGLLKAIRSHRISSPAVQESLEFGRPNACNQCHLDKTLDWTADHLASWYQIEKPVLTRDHRTYAASAIWCLTGDAGQRALAAWTLGWESAQDASRKDWIPVVLAQLLADPYDAVRHIAHRSLRSLPGFEDFEYDYTGPDEEHRQAAVRAFRIWQSSDKTRAAGDNRAVLLSEDGEVLGAEFSRLNHRRDNRQVLLAE